MTNIDTDTVNTISNIAAFGRASVTRWNQDGDVLSFDIDTQDHKAVAAVVKTLAVWLKGKDQDIYVERFCSSDCTTIAIENPIMRQDGDVRIDRQDRVRTGDCFIEEMNTHEADGFTIAEVWDKTATGAFRNFHTNKFVGASK